MVGSRRYVPGGQIGLGAVAPTPMRARQADEALRERKSETGHCRGRRLAAAASLPSTITGLGEYRRLMVEVLVKRAIDRPSRHRR